MNAIKEILTARLNLLTLKNSITLDQLFHAYNVMSVVGVGNVYSNILSDVGMEDCAEHREILKRILYTSIYGGDVVHSYVPAPTPVKAKQSVVSHDEMKSRPVEEQVWQYRLEPVEIRELRKAVFNTFKPYTLGTAIAAVKEFDKCLTVSLEDAVNLQHRVTGVNGYKFIRFIKNELKYNPTTFIQLLSLFTTVSKIIGSPDYEHKFVEVDGQKLVKGVDHIRGIIIAGQYDKQEAIRNICVNNLGGEVKVGILISDYGIRAELAHDLVNMFLSKV